MTRDLEGWNLTADEAKMLNHAEYNEFKNRTRYRQTRQGAFEARILCLDKSLPGQGMHKAESDHGKGAAEIRAAAAETPRWRILWDQARRKLTKKQKRILDALLVDFRTTKAAEAARVSRPSVDEFKKTFFKTHFSQCYQAWKRDFG